MRILHYTLGLPPYRSGGLTKYTYDLMKEQVKNRDEIYLLFPGHLTRSNEASIKRYKVINGIKVYELINPLPVPLMNGIKNPDAFMESTDYVIYKEFLNSLKIEIINVHTLMGLHKEFFIAAKEIGIPIVYTTHDYFGLCPKVNFLDSNSILCEDRNPNKCSHCNLKADSLKKIRVLQSKEYRFMKNLGMIEIIKKLKSYIKSNKNLEDVEKNTVLTRYNFQSSNYGVLLEYYKEMFTLVDSFIFNSKIAKQIYNKYINVNLKGDIVAITHKDIQDNRQKKILKPNELRLTYLGPDKPYKGFDLLMSSMKYLRSLGYSNINLNIYGNTSYIGKIDENIKINGKYVYSDLERIFKETDLLIVPSRWYETFGFITLEAISYGVPVLLTDKVGSKDILKGNFNKGIIIPDSAEDIVKTLIMVYKDRLLLENMNDNILNDEFNITLSHHYQEINTIYRRILEDKIS